MNGKDNQGKDEFRTAVTMTVLWVAGLTLVVIFGSLFAGILLDKVLDTKPLFTILLIVGSIPLTIYLTLRVVKSAAKNIKQASKPTKSIEEESHRGDEN